MSANRYFLGKTTDPNKPSSLARISSANPLSWKVSLFCDEQKERLFSLSLSLPPPRSYPSYGTKKEEEEEEFGLKNSLA